MTKWEYKIETQGEMGLVVYNRLEQLGRKPEPNTMYFRKPDEVQALNEIGQQGWELVNAIYRNPNPYGGPQMFFYFRRPVVE